MADSDGTARAQPIGALALTLLPMVALGMLAWPAAAGVNTGADDGTGSTANATAGAGANAKDPLAGSIIPRNLKDALQQLEALLPLQQTEEIRAGNSSPDGWDRTVGAQILRDWIDPPGSTLVTYFRGLGIDHPRDISGLLDHFYYLYLNHRLRRSDVRSSIRFVQSYWARLLTPEKVAAADTLSARAARDPALLPSAYALNARLVADDFDGSTLNARSIPLIDQERAELDAWLREQVAARVSGDPGAFRDIVAELDPDLHALTVDLGSATLISIDESGIGRLLVTADRAGQPPALWRMDLHLPAAGPFAEQLRCWLAVAGTRPCAARQVGSLPPDTQGEPGFYVDADYAQPAGATRGHQLSLWRWDGRTATPIDVVSYSTGGDAEGQGVEVEGDSIRIRSKGFYQTLDACGGCDGRQLVQHLRLTPSDQVEDLGTASLTPELDLIDALYTRAKNHQPLGDLASAAALLVVEGTWNAPDRQGAGNLFMNVPQEVTREAGRHELCFLAYYGLGAPMPPIRFTFAGSGDELRVVGARANPDAGARACAPQDE